MKRPTPYRLLKLVLKFVLIGLAVIIPLLFIAWVVFFNVIYFTFFDK